MSFEMLGETTFNNSALASFSPGKGISSGFIKILASGELAAQAGDRRLLVRVNGATQGYQGFVHMGGHAGAGEWDNSGFYLGRNGWSLDATFMLEFTLAVTPTSQKITGSGASVFAHGNNTILGYECHSFLVASQPISNIDVIFTGGVATGQVRFYLL